MNMESWQPGETAKKVYKEESDEGHIAGQTELAADIANEQVRTAQSMLHLNEAETLALAVVYKESMDKVSEAVKNAYYKDDAEAMEKARTGCSRISLENINDQLAAVDASKEDAREITNYAVAVCTELASEGLKTQGVDIPEDVVEKISNMSGEQILNELVKLGLAKTDEGFAKVFTQSAARSGAPDSVVRAATVGILCANGAWNQVQAIRAIQETKAGSAKPGTGADRIEESKVTAYGPFGKMLKSMYEKGVSAGGTAEIGLMRSLYEVAKDIAQVTKAVERAA